MGTSLRRRLQAVLRGSRPQESVPRLPHEVRGFTMVNAFVRSDHLQFKQDVPLPIMVHIRAQVVREADVIKNLPVQLERVRKGAYLR